MMEKLLLLLLPLPTNNNRNTEMINKTLNPIFSKEIEDVAFSLTIEKEVELVTRSQSGDYKARNELLESQLKQITSVARAYADYRSPLTELVNEAVLGFDHAVKKFDLDKGLRFVTYYGWWVRDYVNRYVLQNRTVRTPLNHAKKSANKIAEELEAGINVKQMAVVHSMDKPMNEGESATYGDSIQSATCIESEINTKRSMTKVLRMLTKSSREWKILKYHYIDGMTMREIADIFGISKQGVHASMMKTIVKVQNRMK